MHHLTCHQRSKLQTKLATLGYYRKIPNRGKGVGNLKTPLEFLDLSPYTPGRFHPCKI